MVSQNKLINIDDVIYQKYNDGVIEKLDIESLKDFVTQKYNGVGVWFNKLNKSVRNNEQSVRDDNDVYIDGEQVTMSYKMIDILMEGYEYYRIMLHELLADKSIGNCEFAINLLDNPILRVEGDRLKNPLSDSLGKLAKDIEITENVIPTWEK